jgi:hypothetical protein
MAEKKWELFFYTFAKLKLNKFIGEADSNAMPLLSFLMLIFCNPLSDEKIC